MLRLSIEQYLSTSGSRELLQQILGLIRHATCFCQTTNYFAFIVSDRELVQRSHRSRDEEHNVARAHEHDVATFQTKARIDQNIARVGW